MERYLLLPKLPVYGGGIDTVIFRGFCYRDPVVLDAVDTLLLYLGSDLALFHTKLY